MAVIMRAPSMLPSIKCSNCASEVEISKMGEHICTGVSQNDAPRGYQSYPQRIDSPLLSSADDEDGFLRPSRFVPPRIDPSLANRSYTQQNLYTLQRPAITEARPSQTSYMANGKSRSDHGRRQPLPREPSAELSSNLDCAFPPFPITPVVSTPRSDTSLASPGSSNGPSPYALVAQRRDSPQARSASSMSHQSQLERDEAKRDAFFGRKCSGSRSKAPQRQPMNGSDNEYSPYACPTNDISKQDSLKQQPSLHPQIHSTSGSQGPPPRPGRPGGEVDNFIASLKEDPVGARVPTRMPLDLCSEMLPQDQTRPGLGRRPSEPLRNTNQTQTQNQLPERAATTNDLSNPYAPSGHNSRDAYGSEVPSRETPTMPTSNVRRGYGHASAISDSSSGSSVSMAASLPRTGRTTPMSDAPSMPGNKSPPTYLSARTYGDTDHVSDPYAQHSQPTSYLPNPQPYAPDTLISSDFNPYAPPKPAPSAHGHSHTSPCDSTWAPRATPALARSGTSNSLASTTTTTKPRHVCRGCTQPIIGKSIKCADGGLTGRYHRACFVCTTCSSPFSGAEFYELHDKPYCEHHYHELNGSLCTSCNKGIEGQYLETEKREKFHPRCLCCSTCRETLGAEYFDVGGMVFCERHAMAEVRRLGSGQGQGQNQSFLGVNGGWRAERRQTRLGMFM